MPPTKKASFMTVKKTSPRPALRPSSGVPAGRLLELQLETNIPKPYVVTDQLTIAPPTKARADKIREAQMVVMVYNTLLSEAMRRPNTDEDTLNGLTKYITDAEKTYTDALFGEHHEAITELLLTLDDQLAQAFQKDIVKQFFPDQPVDGKCGTCGHVIDEEAAGKAPASTA